MPFVAKARADGYTLTALPASFLTTNKSIFKTLPYEPETDFMLISRLVNQPMVLIVKDKQNYPTVAALLAAAKAQPGEITYASSGDGSPQHLVGVMFEARTNAPRSVRQAACVGRNEPHTLARVSASAHNGRKRYYGFEPVCLDGFAGPSEDTAHHH
jgi:tripartite-type tricarboxylate transporter receptor subunit TctC